MGGFLGSLVLVSVIFVETLAINPFAPGARHLHESAHLAGRWRVKFTIAGVDKNLILVAQAAGTASQCLDERRKRRLLGW